jgi:cellulose synthase/poly-beta-1,6-N-acetylglucosamine synthase-like glycosyltransferase
MISFVIVAVFWSSIIIIFYAYAGFPIVLAIVGMIRNRRVRKAPIMPSVSLIIAAYNEEAGITKKLENSLELDYPSDQLEIIVASDGSDDSTESIVRGYADKGIKLMSFPRRGKIFALKDAISKSTGEILVFSDANTHFHRESIKKLVSNYADIQVGGVCGNQVHTDKLSNDNTTKGEKLYWVYDKWLKKMETLTGSIVSADGAIYSIRRELFQFPKSTAVTDDFAISTAVIEQGYRLVFESEALAAEDTMSGAKEEFGRKVRIINRGLRGVFLRKNLLNPLNYGFYSLVLFSHKLLRRLVPIFLLSLFATSIFLSGEGKFFSWVMVAQSLFYTLAGISYLLKDTQIGRSKVFYIPFFYCLANAASLIAFFKLLRGTKIELWQPQR